MSVIELINERITFGYAHHGCGMLDSKNDHINFREKLVGKLVDAVIYSSADAVRNTSQVTIDIKTIDDGSVRIGITVNYELDHDGNDAVFENIIKQRNRRYEYTNDKLSSENERMLMCLNSLEYVFRY